MKRSFRSAGRAKSSSPAPVLRPPEPEVILPETKWRHDRRFGLQHGADTSHRIVRDVLDGGYRLPRFQRAFVWDDAEAMFLLDSLLKGLHIGTIFLWERYSLPASVENFGGIEVACEAGSGRLVVDGQQRVGSILRAFCSGRYYVHLLEGVFKVGTVLADEGAWWCPLGLIMDQRSTFIPHDLDIFEWSKAHAARYHLEEGVVWRLMAQMHDVLCWTDISSCRIDYHWDLPAVLETFRRINTTGRQFSEEEMATALERAQQCDPS